MKEVNGTVIDINIKGMDSPTIVTVFYEIDGINYTIKESLKYKNEKIKMGLFTIGQKKVPKVKCIKGETVVIQYNENNPEEGHIKGNDGIINC